MQQVSLQDYTQGSGAVSSVPQKSHVPAGRTIWYVLDLPFLQVCNRADNARAREGDCE
jgi:hypothetical protein